MQLLCTTGSLEVNAVPKNKRIRTLAEWQKEFIDIEA